MTKNKAVKYGYKKLKGGIKRRKMENVSLKFGALLLMSVLLIGIVPFAEAGIRDANKEAREKYASAKSDFVKMRNDYVQARQDFLNAKQKYGNKHSTTLDAAKNFMMKADKVTIAHLTKMKSFVEADVFLKQSDKDSIVAEIEKNIAWLEAKQSEITGAEDKETLVVIGKDIKNYWNNVRVSLKKHTGKILNARALWVLEQADKAEVTVEKHLQKAIDSGKDTTELESLLEDFRDKKALAESEYDKAKKSFSAISDLQDANRLFKEGNQFIKKGNGYIRDAYQDLKSINRELRN